MAEANDVYGRLQCGSGLYRSASLEPKELVIVPDADHVALYDNMEKIPFDKLKQFFNDNLR